MSQKIEKQVDKIRIRTIFLLLIVCLRNDPCWYAAMKKIVLSFQVTDSNRAKRIHKMAALHANIKLF